MTKNVSSSSSDQFTCELLNTLVYNNYGQVLSSCCVDVSLGNRLAIGTDRCLVLLGHNLDWPSSLLNSSPLKFLNKTTSAAAAAAAAATSAVGSKGAAAAGNLMDAWIEDLAETSNESFSVHVVRVSNRSTPLVNFYKQYFDIESQSVAIATATNTSKRLKRGLKNQAAAAAATSDDDNKQVAEAAATVADNGYELLLNAGNKEQCAAHARLVQQARLYDAHYYEYLSSLNPLNTSQSREAAAAQTTQAPTTTNTTTTTTTTSSGGDTWSGALGTRPCADSFRCVKWSRDVRGPALLAALTASNQLIVYDFSSLHENTSSSSRQQQQQQQQHSRLVTTHVRLDLTERWLLDHRRPLLDSHKSDVKRSVDAFLHALDQITPVSFAWSEASTALSCEPPLLVVAFKSNDVAVFSVVAHRSTLGHRLVASWPPSSIQRYTAAAAADFAYFSSSFPFARAQSTQPTATTVSSIGCFSVSGSECSVIALGLTNGVCLLRALRVRVANENENEKSSEWLQVEPASIGAGHPAGPVTNIQLIEHDSSIHSKTRLLVIVQKENRLFFFFVVVVTAENGSESSLSLEQSAHARLAFQARAATCGSSSSSSSTLNYLGVPYSRLLDCKLMGGSRSNKRFYEFFLFYENSSIERLLVELHTDDDNDSIRRIELVQCRLLLRTHNNDLSQAATTKGGDPAAATQFRTSKRILVSSNGYLLYQLCDFGRELLLQRKKPPNFQLTVYRIKSTSALLAHHLLLANSHSDTFDPQTTTTTLNQSDALWLFKRQLYLNGGSGNFDALYAALKSFKSTTTTTTTSNVEPLELTRWKRMRLVCLYLSAYFDIVDQFAAASSNQSSKQQQQQTNDDDNEEEDDEDDDEDDEDDDDDDDGQMEDDESNANTATNAIIKSSGYYTSMCRELSMQLLRRHALAVLRRARQLGMAKLANGERLCLLVMGDFAVRRQLIDDNDHDHDRDTDQEIKIASSSPSKSLAKWLTAAIAERRWRQLLHTAVELKCAVCASRVCVEASGDLSRVVCERGHASARCSRTLLPLVLKFERCAVCHAVWNSYTDMDTDTVEFAPHLAPLLCSHKCLFCDQSA